MPILNKFKNPYIYITNNPNPMQGFNHIAGGLAFTGLFASFSDVNVFEKPEYIAITVVASLLPDIDHTKSLIGKLVFPIAKIISIKYGHRTITHSLAFMLFVIVLVKFTEILFKLPGNSYSILTGYALLSHNVFDMCTRQGVEFFYPFSTRPCVLPGNPGMRLRTNDLKSEAVVFIVFCCMILFCQPLFANGFWQQYNKAFMTFDHLERETKRKTDYLTIKYITHQNDTLSGVLVGNKNGEFITYTGQEFERHRIDQAKFLSFAHSGKLRKLNTFQVIGVTPDSMKKHLNQPFLKLQLQCNEDIQYFEGVAQKASKTVEKEFVSGFDFYIQETDNSTKILEIEALQSRINEQLSRFNQEIQLIQNDIDYLNTEYRSGESRFNNETDYQKGLWVHKRLEIKNDLERLYHEKNRKIPPSLEADQVRLQSLKKDLNQNKILMSGSFVKL